MSSYNDERNGKERKLLPSVIFLALVLSLTAAAIYLILDGMGMIGPKDKAHPPTQSPSVEDSTESDVPDPENPQVPVVPPPSPAIAIQPSPAPPEPSETKPEATPEILDPVITPEDINKPGEIPTELPEPVPPPQ